MNTNKFGKVILAFITATLLISACVKTDEAATATPLSIEAISTIAAATIYAGQTGTAIAQPSKTPSPTNSITPTWTITPTLAATRAVYVQPVLPVYTIVSTTTGTPGTLVPTVTGTFGAVSGKNSAIVQDVAVPSMQAGETFTKTWIVKNIGTTAWTSSYKITYIGGNVMGRDYSTKIFTAVAPGGTYTQNLKFTAPSSPGTYTGTWRLADESGNLFGSAFSVVVTVPGATYTPTSSVSATPNGTATAAAATANANAVATGVAASATANANATSNANAVATAVAATQTQNAVNAAANAAATQAAAAAQTQAAIDAANAAATQAAIDATATSDALTAAAPPPSP